MDIRCLALKKAWELWKRMTNPDVTWGEVLKRAWIEIKENKMLEERIEAYTGVIVDKQITIDLTDEIHIDAKRWTKGHQDRLYLVGYGINMKDAYYDIQRQTLCGRHNLNSKLEEALLSILKNFNYAILKLFERNVLHKVKENITLYQVLKACCEKGYNIFNLENCNHANLGRNLRLVDAEEYYNREVYGFNINDNSLITVILK